MKKTDIIRAWKDAAYRNSLGAAERAALPANPAGELADEDLATVTGGALLPRTFYVATFGCPCPPDNTFNPIRCPSRS